MNLQIASVTFLFGIPAILVAFGALVEISRKMVSFLTAERKVRSAIRLGDIDIEKLYSSIAEADPEFKKDLEEDPQFKKHLEQYKKWLEEVILSLGKTEGISEAETKAILEPLNQPSKEGCIRYMERLLRPLGPNAAPSTSDQTRRPQG